MEHKLKNTFVVELLCERFLPLTHYAGPLYSGSYFYRDGFGKVYLTESGTWLFSGAKTDDVFTLNHQQFSEIASSIVVSKHLLSSLIEILQQFQEHLKRVEDEASDPLFLLGYYLHNPDLAVVDAIALQKLPKQQEEFHF